MAVSARLERAWDIIDWRVSFIHEMDAVDAAATSTTKNSRDQAGGVARAALVPPSRRQHRRQDAACPFRPPPVPTDIRDGGPSSFRILRSGNVAGDSQLHSRQLNAGQLPVPHPE